MSLFWFGVFIKLECRIRGPLLSTCVASEGFIQIEKFSEWRLSGEPFLTTDGKLFKVVCDSIKEITGIETKTSTGGGTSDGRFIAPTGAEVIELGPVNSTIHKVNECVKVEDLVILSDIYALILQKLMT